MANDTLALGTMLELFAAYSGRSDLSRTANTWLINQGGRMLDRLGNWPHNRGRHIVTIAAGEYHFALPRQVRAVKYAYIKALKGTTITGATADGTQWLLGGPKNITEIQQLYPDMTDISIRSGPAIWGDGWRTLIMPDAGVEGLDLPADLADVAADSAVADHVSMVIAPPPDKAYHLILFVYKYTPDLVADADTNFWSIHFARELMLATKAVYQESLDNYPTADKIRGRIEAGLLAYHKDMVEGEFTNLPTGVYTAEGA